MAIDRADSWHSGYLPHSGVATIQEFITGTQTVFGMAEVSFLQTLAS